MKKKVLQYFRSFRNLSLLDCIKLLFRLPFYWFCIRKGLRYIEVRVNNSYKMLIDLKDRGISKELMLLGAREKEHYVILKNELKKGMAVFDLGANIGYYAVMMGQLVGENGKVYAVEPSDSNFKMLNLNIKLNNLEDIVETYNIGISVRSGYEKFYESEKSNWHTFYPKIHSLHSLWKTEYKAPREVPVVTVSDFVKGKRSIELIRMDVEGYEVEIFNSIAPLLKNKLFNPKILFEVHQPRYDEKEHNMKECLKKIFDKGYSVAVLASNDHDGGARKIFADRGYQPKEIIRTDYLKRGIYYDIKNEDAVYFICDTNFTRTALLRR